MKLRIDMGPLGTVELEGDRAQDLLKEAALWQSMPVLCSFEGCGMPLRFQVRPTSKGTYYELICSNDPAHTKQIHEKKPENGGGMYVIPNEKFEVEYSARQGGGDDSPEGWNEQPRNQPQGQQQTQSAQQTTNQQGRQTSATAENVDVKDKMANMLATTGCVRKVDNHYMVDMGDDSFTIINDDKRGILCSCEKQGCVHFLAVKKFHAGQLAAQGQGAPTQKQTL